jgi:MHS family proline/betaine transporter-like MFS transporter
MDLGGSLQFTAIVSASLVGLIALTGYLSDVWVRRRRMLMGSFLVAMLLSVPLFWLVQTSGMAAVFVSLGVFGLVVAIPLGVAPSTITELFPTDDRLTGYSIAYNVGLGVIGGSTPVIVTMLIRATGNLYMPAFYIFATSLISFLGLYFMKDRSREPLR